MNFLAGLTKGLSVVQSLFPFVDSTVTSVESLLGGAPGSVKKAAALQIIGSGLSVAAAATGAPAVAVSARSMAVAVQVLIFGRILDDISLNPIDTTEWEFAMGVFFASVFNQP